MSDSNAPTSAFAIYSTKRKTAKAPFASKKLKAEPKIANGVVPNTDINEQKNKVGRAKFPTKINASKIAKSKMLAQERLLKKRKKLVHKVLTESKRVSCNDESEYSKIKHKRANELVVQRIKNSIKKSKSTQKKRKNVAASIGEATDTINLDVNIENTVSENPRYEARKAFQWLIQPLKVNDFFNQNWEKTPLHIKRTNSKYYKMLMSTPILDKILRDYYILFTKNIDITSYTDGVRETHNPPGRAVPSVVWDYYMNGCSVRMLNPQTFIPKLHTLNATLQEYFNCFVGANSYLTPPDSQGFAPHYDDIEAFILQIEGKKRWRLYKPLSEGEYLPRYSSRNFNQDEIGEPILDTIVNAGDLLYIPRGTIHQGETIDNAHSLHVTLSVYQRNSWGDFLEKLLPDALKQAIESDSEFRRGMPLDYLSYTGCAHAENVSDRRHSFMEKVENLCAKVIDRIDIDKAADVMGKNHIHDFLPPVLSDLEKQCSVVQDGERMCANGIVENRVEIEPDTRIRLLRAHCIRLVEEPEGYKIYYSTENSKEYHEYDLQFLEVDPQFVPAIKELILRYPEYIRVEDLPIDGNDNNAMQVYIAKDLWEKCIIVTESPLPIIE